MAGLIKGQILKHLSKFTKNLSPDKINISTMKGEGDLSNLELDEVALMEVMDLPTWLRLTKAVCNRVAIKIQWTKLKTHPICIYLDEIVVEMETCSTPRDPASSEYMANLAQAGKYGFAERIIDGIHLSINSVIVNFKAPAFHASIQLSRIFVTSKTPVWQNGDLRLTRIKDDLRGEILIFKEMEWQTLRIEANALEGVHPNMSTTPLRLIANQSKTRITIRKRLADCCILASRVQFHLDDLLWVLTDSQMKAAFLFATSLKEIIHKSSLKSKHMAAEKIQKQMSFGSGATQQKSAPKPTSKSQIAIAKLYDQHDVVETSYHVYTGRIDLHLCDDSAPEAEGYRRKVEGGAMQLTLHKLMLDHYPYHPSGKDRSHWLRYDENMMARQTWAQDLLSLFRQDVRKVRDIVVANTPPSSPDKSHEGFKRGQGQTQGQSQGQTKQNAVNRLAAQTSITGASKPTKLLESCTVLRLEDFTIYRVSTANDHKRNAPKKFASSDKKQLLLPAEMSCIHVEYTEYYFPEGIDYPVPSPNLYVVVNPMRLTVDFLTIIWLNAFSLNMLATLDLPQTEETKIHVDTKIDALMPRIILAADSDVKGQPDRPDGLQIQVSKATMTNVRIEPKASYNELHHTIKLYECGKLFRARDFPMERGDLVALSDSFKHHLQRTDHAFLNKGIGDIVIGRGISEEVLSPSKTPDGIPKGLTYYNMDTDSLKLDAKKDIWCMSVDQFWMEFIGVPSSKSRPVPFIESFPLTLWVSMPQSPPPTSKPPSGPASPRSGSPRTLSDHRIPHQRDDYHPERHRRNSYHSSSPHSPHGGDWQSRRRSPHRNSPINYVDGHGESPRGSRRNSYHSDSPGRDSPTRRMRPDSPIKGRDPWDVIDHSPHQRTFDFRRDPRDGYDHRPHIPVAEDVPRQYGDIYGIVKIGAKVNVEINHYQFLFILRLLESISKFQAELVDDTNYICKLQDIKVRQVVISVVVPEFEAALVCPPIPTAPKSMETESRQDSLDLQEAGLLEHDSSQGPPAYTEMDFREPLPYTNGINGPSQMISKSYSDTEIVSNASSNDLTGLVDNQHQNQAFGQPLTRYASGTICGGQALDSVGSHRPVSISVTSSEGTQGYPSSSLYRAASTEQVSRDNRKSGDFKKSINNAWSNFSRFSEKVKQNVKKDLLDIDDDELETTSVRSGDSDDEDFVVLRLQNQMEAPAFERHNPAHSDTASVTDASNDQDDSLSTTPEKATKLVSVVSFRCVNLEAVLQTRGEDMIVSATIDNVIPVEYGNIDLDKFQAKLAAESEEGSTIQAYISQSQNIVSSLHILTGHKEEEDIPKEKEEVANPPIKLRYMLGPQAEELVPRGQDLGFLKVIVENLRMSLGMSSVTSLTELIEDEFIPEAMPMLIHNKSAFVKIVKICPLNLVFMNRSRTPTEENQTLNNSNGAGSESDTPPHYNTSPGPVPLDLCVRDLVIWRGEEGIFHISAAANAVPFNREMHRVRDHRDHAGYSDYTHGAGGDFSMHERQEVSQLRQRVVNLEDELKKRPKNEWDTKVVKTLEHENDQLRRQLEKIAKLDSHAANEKLQREVDYLREHTPEKLQKENSRLHQDLQRSREDVQMYREERESLLTAIRALQDDLAFVENQQRHKNS